MFRKVCYETSAINKMKLKLDYAALFWNYVIYEEKRFSYEKIVTLRLSYL